MTDIPAIPVGHLGSVRGSAPGIVFYKPPVRPLADRDAIQGHCSLLYPLRYPSPSKTDSERVAAAMDDLKRRLSGVDEQILLHKRDIEESEIMLRELKAKLEESEREIAALELIRDDLHEDLAHATLMQGPWRPSRLPPETLYEIFLHYVDVPSQSAWQLVHVCRAWRRAALGCPLLWNKVRFSTDQSLSPTLERYIAVDSTGDEWVVTRLQAQRALWRTGTAPLDIELDLSRSIGVDRNQVESILYFLGGNSLSRWRSLRFRSPAAELWVPAVRGILRGDTSSLQDLKIYSTDCEALLPCLKPSRLLSLTIIIDGRRNSFQTSLNPSWLSGLRKLSFRGGMRFQALVSTIAHCQSLEELGLHLTNVGLVPNNMLSSNKRSSLLSSLRVVRLGANVFLWPCISGLKITTLSLVPPHSHFLSFDVLSLPHRSISVQCLTDLDCGSYEIIFAAGYLLDAPKLQSLRVSHPRQGDDAGENPRDVFCESVWGIRPHRVDLCTDGTHDASLRALFRRLTDVETLVLDCGPQTVTALRILAPDRDGTEEATAPCPRLGYVRCKLNRNISPGDAETINGIGQEVQRTRELLGLSCPVIHLRRDG